MTLVPVLGLAALSWRWLESPAIRWGRRFDSAQRKAAPQPVSGTSAPIMEALSSAD